MCIRLVFSNFIIGIKKAPRRQIEPTKKTNYNKERPYGLSLSELIL